MQPFLAAQQQQHLPATLRELSLINGQMRHAERLRLGHLTALTRLVFGCSHLHESSGRCHSYCLRAGLVLPALLQYIDLQAICNIAPLLQLQKLRHCIIRQLTAGDRYACSTELLCPLHELQALSKLTQLELAGMAHANTFEG